MTRRQRMLAAIRREPVDRVPFCTYNLHPYMSGEHARDESYRALLCLVEEKAGMLCKADLKAIRPQRIRELHETRAEVRDGNTVVTTIVHTPRGDLRSVTVAPKNQPSRVTESLVKSDADIERYLSLPYEPPQYDITGLLEFETQVGERGLLYVSYADPMYSVATLFDFEEFTIRCLTDLKQVKRLVDGAFEHILHETRAILRACAGHDFLFYTTGPEVATPPMLPPWIFHELVTPYQRKLIEVIHGSGFLCSIHCHGHVRRVLDEIVATGADALEPIEPPPQGDIALDELIERVGGRIALIGYVQDQEFHTAPQGTMTKRVEEIARIVRAQTGYIMSPTCTPFQHPAAETFLRNYAEWVEAAARIL